MSDTAPPLLPDVEFQRLHDLVMTRTGLAFRNLRRNALERAAIETIRLVGCKDLAQLYNLLQNNTTNSEVWAALIKGITIPETYFWREPEQITALRQHILPNLIARHWSDRTLHLWSAGCSTGEEPYTLAILLRQLIPDIESWKISLLATDLNKTSLAQASEGHYRAWSFRQVEDAFRQAHFIPQDDEFILDPQIRKMVSFAYLNLVEDVYPSPETHTNELDLILCRNVTIYLPEPAIREIAKRFYRCLIPGGWLVVGASEMHIEYYQQFQTLKFNSALVYQRNSNLPAGKDETQPPQFGNHTRQPFSSPPSNQSAGSFSEPAAALRQSWPIRRAPPPEPPSTTAGPSSPDLLEKGNHLLAQRQYDEAMACYRICLESPGIKAAVLLQMARLEADRMHLDDARRWLDQSLELDPLQAQGHLILGMILHEQGDTQSAITHLRKTLYLEQDNILAHYYLAILYHQIDMTGHAARHRKAVVRLASHLKADAILPGTDNMTAGELLNGLKQSH